MLSSLFTNRIFIGTLAFFCFCVAAGTLYQKHVERQTAKNIADTEERIKPLTEKQPPTTHAPLRKSSQGGHFHSDGTWHAEPHTPGSQGAPTTAQVNAPVSPGPKKNDAETQNDLYQESLRQYDRDYRKWLEKYQRAFEEIMPERHALRAMLPDSPEDDSHVDYAAIQAQHEKVQEMNKTLEAIRQEMPVRPPPPQNN